MIDSVNYWGRGVHSIRLGVAHSQCKRTELYVVDGSDSHVIFIICNERYFEMKKVYIVCIICIVCVVCIYELITHETYRCIDISKCRYVQGANSFLLDTLKLSTNAFIRNSNTVIMITVPA